MIGIICALNVEVEGLIDKMENTMETSKAGMTFYSGTVFGKEVVAVECGIGKVNAAMCAQVMIDLFAPSQIINSGIAGALSEETQIGDVVICRDVVQHDMDATALGDPLGLIQFNDCKVMQIAADESIIAALETACKSVDGAKFEVGRIATGDTFVSAKEQRRKINSIFGAIACEMEGGAIAQVCFRNKIPFGITRAISDSVKENEAVDFFKFRNMAAQQSIKILCEYIRTH
ncbi:MULTISPECIES: 5'-methylthioadenosine/adenosylhomocysteine nucleosidase [unclassified Ruminococcus]|uniref:5'-methylthioadenosine/adenosylhomocysteine nucleosidase n=1 Tax=unclassified Ruminococcus TaxID=2608920 RepID=UPI00210C902C|nr:MULTISPECIES: 5'-methylthioadenosine/adenosylhomocysteine nucleosidase [unclassified Ruminococcus]MCQ4021595.1 5'-methylthioadenosine/adenosylhomocysteine nucleosidase [Ruminococcus sp. zg-924]MCQ4114040.1 5'-methylthioadenosine/adenosylhomocysteine nucleosidase [Ruminococcus sp. zg-921]